VEKEWKRQKKPLTLSELGARVFIWREVILSIKISLVLNEQ